MEPVEIEVTMTFRAVVYREDYYDDLEGSEVKLMTPAEIVAAETRIAKEDPSDSDLLNDMRGFGTMTGFTIALVEEDAPAPSEAPAAA